MFIEMIGVLLIQPHFFCLVFQLVCNCDSIFQYNKLIVCTLLYYIVFGGVPANNFLFA